MATGLSSPMRQSTPFLGGSEAAVSQNGRRGRAEGSQAGDMEDEGRDGGGEDEAEEEGAGRAGRGRRRKNYRGQEDVPRVVDETSEKVRESFEGFLENFVEDAALAEPQTPASDIDGEATQHHRFYIEQIKGMEEARISTLYVDFSHLLDREEILAKAIEAQYYRFLPSLRQALRNLVEVHAPSYLYTNTHSTSSSSQHRVTREFSIAFYNLPLVSGIRDLRTEKIGALMSISGTVTRTSEVRPELIWGTFVCGECKTVVRDVEQQFKYTEPTVCPNIECNNRSIWTLSIEQSKFSDWQKVRIQENSNEIPTGSMPRSMDVILRAEAVEHAKAGDKCVFTGSFIVVPDVAQLGLPGVNAQMMRETGGGRGGGMGGLGASGMGITGLKILGVRDLTYKTAFLACMVQRADLRTASTNVRGDGDFGVESDREEFLSTLTPEEVEELREMVQRDDIYARLVKSIAPTVWGHEIVKKGILLQLMGGVHKQTREGIHLRGDLNVCVVGDPSTSKSQFLKYVCGFLPRAVYTSGKASSAAGLTAAVVKDEETGEFTIEAGALMLADNGICAIDEFDKMDISDQVAIHEAMEQQTISIAKAGIQATLNARTSILAAANPVGGRYNRKMSLRANVAMSAPIMSRFDLFFVVLDECNEDMDRQLARHIVNVHRYQDAAIDPEFSTDLLQRYIRYARTFNPKLTSRASKDLVEYYRILRQDDSQGFGKNSYRITVRQLESMIRLSEAIARANCKSEITPAMVKEAFNLLRQSIIHVEKDDIEMEEDEDEPAPEGGDGADGNNDQAPPSSLPHASGTPTRGATAAPEDADMQPAEKPKKVKTVISHDKYVKIINLVVSYLSERERKTGQGITKSEVAVWYLEQEEDNIHTEEELLHEQTLINKVLNKMVKEKYLLELRGDGLQEGASAEAESSAAGARAAAAAQPSETILLVHPDLDVGGE